MRKIRFINRGEIYRNVLLSMINPIVKYLPLNSYEINESKYENDIWLPKENFDNSFYISFFSDVYRNFDLFMSHGIADKCYRNADVMNKFNYIGVSGELWKEKLIKQGINKNKILIIGYPKLDELFQNRNKMIKNKDKNKKIINILYAPTHNVDHKNTNDVSSYPKLIESINQDKSFYNYNGFTFNLKVSTHPFNKYNNSVTLNEFENIDVVVSDAGSLLYEALSLNIPVVFPSWIVRDNVFKIFKDSFEEYIYKEKIGYHADNLNNMKELIIKAYQLGIDNKTKEFIDGIFTPELRGKSGETISNFIFELAK